MSDDWSIDWLIDLCLMATLAVFQLYRGMIGQSNYYKLYNVYKRKSHDHLKT